MILTRPGNMTTVASPDSVKPIAVRNDTGTPPLPRACAIADAVADGDTFAVKQGAKVFGGPDPTVACYTYLDLIVSALLGKNLGNGVHLQGDLETGCVNERGLKIYQRSAICRSGAFVQVCRCGDVFDRHST